MEEQWIYWAIFWSSIPITLIFFWMLLNYLEKNNNRTKRKAMVNSIYKKRTKVIENPYPSPNRQKFILSPSCNDIIAKMSLVEPCTGLKQPMSSSLFHEDRTHPPDIYVINEKGKPVQYIMCV